MSRADIELIYAAPVSDARHHVTLALDGGPAAEHRVAVTDLLTVAGGVQTALRNVAAVLVQQPSGQGGRKLKSIEATTELQVVAQPRQSSFALDLELAPTQPFLGGEQLFPGIGDAALEALIDGLKALSEDRDTLPPGFDRGVLRNVAAIGKVFRKGYTHVDLGLNGGAPPRSARLDGERVDVVKKLIAKPLRAQASIEGVLQMVDLGARPLECRVDRPYLSSVVCLIPNEWEPEVRAAHGRRVRVEGEGEFEPQSNEPKRIEVARLVLLPDVPGIDRQEFRRAQNWQELALERKAQPIRNPATLAADVFEDDDELDAFLTTLRAD